VGKNVAVFVDVANIFYAAKAAGVDIDYVLLLKAATAGRDLVRAYAYTGLDPDNENQRNFHSFLARHDFRVVSKDIRKYGDGKVKANLDIELVVDMMKTARNLDVAVVVSGDGDFAPAIRAVQEMGVRVEVISFRGNTSSDLMDVADKFTDITQLAKVEKGSTVSGRRVATDEEEDLSMTEVPDKLSEGTGRGRGRGRARVDREPLAATRTGVERAARPSRARRPAAVTVAELVPEEQMDDQGVIIALPGEKLSKARIVLPPLGAAAETGEPEDAEAVAAVEADEVAAVLEADGEGEAPRRRRRRGGRGRGRGRGHEGDLESSADVDVQGLPQAVADVEEELEFVVDDESIPAQAPRPARPAAFGSVWDSQIGIAAPAAGRAAQADEEFDDEPEIPEYLLAERRNRGGQSARGGQPISGNRAGRARGGSYAAAIDRERYGRGGAPSSAGGTARYGEPAGRGGVSRDVQPRRDVAPRRDAPLRRDAGRPIQARPERLESRPESSEPWSEVPPELEELLKAQLALKLGRQAEARPAASTAAPSAEPARAGSSEPVASRARGRRRPAAAAVPATAGVPDAPASEAAVPLTASPAASTPAPARRRRAASASAPSAGPDSAAAPAIDPVSQAVPAPKRRAGRARAGASAAPAPEAVAKVADAPKAAPKRRATRAAATSAAPAAAPVPAADPAPGSVDAPAPKRRAARKAAAPAEGA
jgi:uncharacterized LabA/DUF88 family protein